MSAGRFDWPSLMRAGLGALRLPPESFWAMTPREFLCALEGAGLAARAEGPLGRAGLKRLMAACPDLSRDQPDSGGEADGFR